MSQHTSFERLSEFRTICIHRGDTNVPDPRCCCGYEKPWRRYRTDGQIKHRCPIHLAWYYGVMRWTICFLCKIELLFGVLRPDWVIRALVAIESFFATIRQVRVLSIRTRLENKYNACPAYNRDIPSHNHTTRTYHSP